ncbi:MAG: hypothetical protein AB1715_13800, partial [Acidobacteriota bacterium]
MLNEFIKELEKRPPVSNLLARFSDLFDTDQEGHLKFSEKTFSDLLVFLETGEATYQNLAVQAGVRWTASTRKVALRNAIAKRGFISPSCMWAFRHLRGGSEELFRDYPSPEMRFMQILLLKEAEPAQALPFLIESFINRKETPEELRTISRICVVSILNSGVSPELMQSLRSRYPGLEILHQWRPRLPGRPPDFGHGGNGGIDFHQLVRSLHDIKELSSLTRTVYLVSLFYIPLTEKEWRSLLLSRTDQQFFQRLRLAGIVEAFNGGFVLSGDAPKQNMVRKFLYESYSPAKESIRRHTEDRLKEDRERRVRNCELDRQALEMTSDGILCVDRTGLLYYMNPAAE